MTNFRQRIIPKNIDFLTRSIVHWLVFSLMSRFSLSFFGLKTMKFYLIILIESLLARHQSVKLSYSSFKVFSIKFKFLREKKMFVSSAKRMKYKTFETSYISVM